jgi:hypothetical protein
MGRVEWMEEKDEEKAHKKYFIRQNAIKNCISIFMRDNEVIFEFLSLIIQILL